jgi:hypothetical protein
VSRLPERAPVWLAAAVGLFAVIASATSLLFSTSPPPSGAPVAMLPVHYTGEFRYDAGSSPIWCALEVVEVDDRVLDRVIRATAPSGPAGATRAERPCEAAAATRAETRPRRRRQEDPRVLIALGREWQYEGTLGLRGRARVYRRFRTLPVQLPPDAETVSVVNQVERPEIDLGDVRLVPDDASTMRFEGPRRVLRATSPSAEPERFAGQVAYTIPLRDLVRDPRVVIGTPDPPERSFGDRATDWLGDAFGWMTSLIGVAIGAAVAAVAGYVALEWWRRRRPT